MVKGLLTGAGFALAIDGLVHGVEQELSTTPNPGFLLQIYAGYFMVLLITTLFCIACREFKRNKVNFANILELDGRHDLDWRQLFEMPALFLLLLGLIMDLNFNWVGGNRMYVYWPVVLIGVTLLILLFPAPIYYHRTRKWFVNSVWRKLIKWLLLLFNPKMFADVDRCTPFRCLSRRIPRPPIRGHVLFVDLCFWQCRTVLLSLC